MATSRLRQMPPNCLPHSVPIGLLRAVASIPSILMTRECLAFWIGVAGNNITCYAVDLSFWYHSWLDSVYPNNPKNEANENHNLTAAEDQQKQSYALENHIQHLQSSPIRRHVDYSQQTESESTFVDYNPLDYCLQHDQSAEWKTFAEFWRGMSGLADNSCIFLRKSSQPKQILTAPISQASSGKREIQPLRLSPRSRRFLEPRRRRCLPINQKQQNSSLAGHQSRPA